MQTATLILTADPHYGALALAELRQAQPDALVGAALGPGVWAVTVTPFFTLAEQWRLQPPIFVRHICPVQLALPLAGTAADVPLLAERLGQELAGWFDPALPFSVQTRIMADAPYQPFDVNTAVAQAIRQITPAPLDVRAPQQILSLVISDWQGHRQAFAGISLAVHNLSDWAGGARRFARQPGQISRAEFKLLEALELFGIDLPPRGIALDLGAAPGGWTRILRQKEQYVTAVDPAALHPSLYQDKNVRHLRLAAEIYLKQGPDRFDIIVNDMRLDARDSARLMAAYAPHLYRHGLALITLKLPQQLRPSTLEHAFNILQGAYMIAGARQLFHNRHEITVYLKSDL